MWKTEITGGFSRLVPSRSSATHPLPFQELDAIFLLSDSCRTIILWSHRSSSGGSISCVVNGSPAITSPPLLPVITWLALHSGNFLLQLLSHPHTRGCLNSSTLKGNWLLLAFPVNTRDVENEDGVSPRGNSTLCKRVFWDTFCSKHNSVFVKISIASSRGEYGGRGDAYHSSCLMLHSRPLEHSG